VCVLCVCCLFVSVFCYYATFPRLRRECRIQSLLEQCRNLHQFLSTSDAIWLVSDQFNVLTYLGMGPLLTVLALFSLFPWFTLSEYSIYTTYTFLIHYLQYLHYLKIYMVYNIWVRYLHYLSTIFSNQSFHIWLSKY
jgi:hypothetical protein